MEASSISVCLVKQCLFALNDTDIALDTRRGEILTGFHLRAGLWIDGIEILTSLGRKSGVYGNPTGGSEFVLLAF